jgi:hypothetical protein
VLGPGARVRLAIVAVVPPWRPSVVAAARCFLFPVEVELPLLLGCGVLPK